MSRISSFPNPKLRGWLMPADVEPSNWFYAMNRQMLQVLMPSFFNLRVFGRQYEPTSGGVLYVCNHQSFLDPMLMAFSLRRPVSFMARDSLFKAKVFRKIISKANAFPVKRGSADMGALKEAMRRLKRGGQVVVFAEGTRTKDGRIGPFLPGVAMLAQRAAQWTVPMVIDGAYEAWPRTQKFPSVGSNIVVQYAPAVSQEQARKQKSGQAFVNSLRDTIVEMQTDIRSRQGLDVFEE